MKLDEAKDKFVQAWGSLGSNWGIPKTMAQVHALLLISEKPLSAEDIMSQLDISRGNVNLNVRSLIDWGIVDRVTVKGERREFFTAEKDIWKVATMIANQRRKRELDPMLKVLSQVKVVDESGADPEALKAFTSTIENIENFSGKADVLLDKLIKADQHWFTGTLLKLVK
ncbi:MAG: GbsR/MarR family transcriptional regulator [Flavobacteriales bacterium]